MTPDFRIFCLAVTDKIRDHRLTDFAHLVDHPNDRTQLKNSLKCKQANFELMKQEFHNFNNEILMRNKINEECYMLHNYKIATAIEYHRVYEINQ
ncbi:hypothetical protein FHG87_007490 [Trinorchestia longiramus]|nr:hypothetical protein FHG87_007490 [Trinorchestia longiramus]